MAAPGCAVVPSRRRKALQAEQGKADMEARIKQLEAEKKDFERQVQELKAKAEAIEKREGTRSLQFCPLPPFPPSHLQASGAPTIAGERRALEEKKHAEEVQFLKCAAPPSSRPCCHVARA